MCSSSGSVGDEVAHHVPALRVAEQQLGAGVAPARTAAPRPSTTRSAGPAPRRSTAAAQNNTTHSTLLAERIATRSPWPMPQLRERRGHATDQRVVLFVRQAPVTLHEEVDAGAAVGHGDEVAQRPQPVRYTCSGTPSTGSSTISNGPPGCGELGGSTGSLVRGHGVGGASSCCIDVERPQLAAGADRPARVVSRVAVLERRAVDPRVEVGLGPPAGVDEEDVAVVGRAQQLEGLEARRLRHFAGPGGEALDQLVGALGGTVIALIRTQLMLWFYPPDAKKGEPTDRGRVGPPAHRSGGLPRGAQRGAASHERRGTALTNRVPPVPEAQTLALDQPSSRRNRSISDASSSPVGRSSSPASIACTSSATSGRSARPSPLDST